MLPPVEEVNFGSCSLLTGAVTNDGSIGVSSYDMNNENTSIGYDTAAHETNDELIKMLDESDASEVGNGGSSDAEVYGYECVLCF